MPRLAAALGVPSLGQPHAPEAGLPLEGDHLLLSRVSKRKGGVILAAVSHV